MLAGPGNPARASGDISINISFILISTGLRSIAVYLCYGGYSPGIGGPSRFIMPEKRNKSVPPRIRTLFNEETIAARNEELAREIVAAAPQRLLVVAVLKGSFMFAADLIRSLHRSGLAPQVEFIHLSSYLEGTASTGQVTILRDVESDIRDRDVLLVDDILESGRTLAFAKDLLAARGARKVLTAVLLEKPHKRAVSIQADFVGFQCPDLFVVGYGMDVAHSYRQLPFVGIVDYLDTEPELFDRP